MQALHFPLNSKQQDDDIEDDNNSSSSDTVAKKPKHDENVDCAKRPRGRPLGSRNKPRPPVVITRFMEEAAALRPYLLEIPDGNDVAASIARFSRRQGLGVCVLSGTGAVSSVTLHGGTAEEGNVVLRGKYDVLSISATFLPPEMEVGMKGVVSVSVAGSQGSVFGGIVAGPLVAQGAVVVVAAVFLNPSFHRLPAEDEVSLSGSGGGDVQENEQQLSPAGRRGVGEVGVEGCEMGRYGAQLMPGGIWAAGAHGEDPDLKY